MKNTRQNVVFLQVNKGLTVKISLLLLFMFFVIPCGRSSATEKVYYYQTDQSVTPMAVSNSPDSLVLNDVGQNWTPIQGQFLTPTDIEMMDIVTQEHDKDVAAASVEKKASLQTRHDSAASNCVIVSSINAPDHDTEGLAWDAGNLWLSEGEFASTYPGEILDSNASGNILYSFPAPGQSYPDLGLSAGEGVKGLAFDGTYLWSIDYLDHKIYRLNTSGSVIGSIPTPDSSYVASGLAWDGSNLWVSEWNQEIYKINPANGQVLSSFNAPDYGDQTYGPYGLAWDGTHLWVSTNNGIYMIDPATGAVLAACNNSAFQNGSAYGLTWDGQYLWAGSWASNSIIKIDVSTVTGNTGSISTPSGQQSFSYPPVAFPVVNSDPSQAKPIGVGSVAESGDTLNIAVQLEAFSEPVDLYFGLYAPSLDPNNIYIVKQDNLLQTVAQGLVPWRKNVTTSTSESLFGDIPVSNLPSGQYTLYLLVTPAGSLNSYYLWSTNFVVANAAPVQTFGLTVSTTGSGTGFVTSSPVGINSCTSTCSANYDQGTSVILTATPTSSSTFAGWLVNGSDSVCPGTGSCTISMDANESVTATFNVASADFGNYYLCVYSSSYNNMCECTSVFFFNPGIPGVTQTLVGNGQMCDGNNYICSAGLVCYINVDTGGATGVCKPAGSETSYGCYQ